MGPHAQIHAAGTALATDMTHALASRKLRFLIRYIMARSKWSGLVPTALEEHALVESRGRNLPLVIWCVPTNLKANAVIRASAIVPLVYALASRVTPARHA